MVTLSAPDFEVPTDIGGNNTYEFTLTATDTDGNTATSAVTTISVTDATETAIFTVPALANAEVMENLTYTSDPPATEGETPIGALTWALGGDDAGAFTIAATGVVTLSAPDFEVPTDIGGNNTYEFTLTATDTDGNTATSAVTTISVTDATETAIFTVPALADAEVMENLTYTSDPPVTAGETPIGALTWVLGGDDAGAFTIAATGVVTLSAPDFEVPTDIGGNNTYEFTLTATDTDGNTATSAVTTISVTDATETAIFTVPALADAEVMENLTYTSDPPATEGETPIGALTWALGGDDAGAFTIAATGVVTLSAPDFEVPTDIGGNNTYEFTLTATDTDGNTATSAVTTISVTDATETAIFTVPALADAEVMENLTYTSDPPATEGETPIGALTWALGGDDAGAFTIAATGVVTLSAPDFEVPTDIGGNNTYEFTLTATDTDGNTATSAVTTISVTDATETAIFTVPALANAEVMENLTYTSDPPATEGETPIGALTWALGGDDAGAFTIAATGVVTLSAPDFEVPTDIGGNNTYEFTLTATDTDGNTATSAVTTISVTDATETAIFTVPALVDASIEENTTYTSAPPDAPGGTPVGAVIWSLGGTDADDFTIDGTSGVVTLLLPDFEMPTDSDTNNTYHFTLIATDEDDNIGTSDITTITVTDATEPATLTVTALVDASIAENTTYTSAPPDAPGGTPVGAVIWSLGGTDADDFTIDGTSGVVTLVLPDFEMPTDSDTNNTYQFTLIATDADNNTATSTPTTITITDVTETANLTVTALVDASIAENTTYTSAQPTLTGTPIGTVTWTLGGDDADDFTIDGTSGVVTLLLPDFEMPTDSDTNNTYQFTLIATDADDNIGTSDITTITVTDATETATLTVTALVDASIAENTTYTSAPPDAPGGNPVGAVTWTLGGADADDFTIDGTSGVVTLLLPDFEMPTDSDTNNTYQFTLIATDEDDNIGTSDITTITVTDAAETATLTVTALVDASIAENTTYTSAPPDAPGGTPVGAVIWSLGGTDADDFTIDGTSGVVTLLLPDFEMPTDSDTNNTYHFTLIATDADDNIGTSDITTITVTDAVETATLTVIALADASIAENTTYTSSTPDAPGGTPVGAVIWTLGGADADDFTIDGTSGVVTLSPRDFEAPTDNGNDNAYQFTLIATDEAGATGTSPATTITITDVTETFTVTALADASIAENTTYTSAQPTIDVTEDATGAPSGAVTWTLGGADADAFSIDADSGVVTLSPRDFEAPTDSDTNNTYHFTLIATDEAGATGTSPVTTITVTDEAETEPALDRSPLAYHLLPEVARAITDSTVTAITQRLDQARTSPASGTLVLGGQTTLADVLTTSGRALAEGTLDLTDMLRRSAFVLPLDAQGHGLTHMTLWGSGNYRAIGGGSGNGDTVDWDGTLFTSRIGVDTRVRDLFLAGAAFSRTQGTLDYGALADTAQAGGDSTIELAIVQPYLGWHTRDKRLSLWGTAGYGWGDMTITSDTADRPARQRVSDITSRNVGGGISGQVLETLTSQLRLKGELMQTRLAVEGSGDLPEMTVEARRVRLSLAGTTTQTLEDGARLTPTAEVGMRHDAGGGRTGTGAEAGGALRYTDPDNWLTLESHSRVLLGHTGDYEDWGIGGVLAMHQDSSGQGLAFRLAPTYGQTATQTTQLWDQGVRDMAGTDAAALGQRLDAEVGYGLAALDGRSLLTPYGKLTWGQEAREYRLGNRVTLPSGLTMSLEGVRGEPVGAPAAHRFQWQTGWRWLTASLQTSSVEHRLQLKAEWQW